MTVNELIAELQALTPEQRELPVLVAGHTIREPLRHRPRESLYWVFHVWGLKPPEKRRGIYIGM